MKVLQVNNTTFRASLCTNFETAEGNYSLYNYWPRFINRVKDNNEFDSFDKLLTDFCENNKEDIVLSLEKRDNTQDYFIAAYKSDKDVLEDRDSNIPTFFHSVNKAGIKLFEFQDNWKPTDVRMHLQDKELKEFHSLLDAVRYVIEQFKDKSSTVYKTLMSKRDLPSEEYLKQFAQKTIK